MNDWSDPFANDEAARERERRRAERETRRRERLARRTQQQGALAERVRGMMRGSDGDGDGPRVEAAPAARTGSAPPPSPPQEPPRALAARQPPPPHQPGRRGRRLVAAAIVVVLVVGVVAAAAALIHHYTAGSTSSSSPPKQAAGGTKEITIPEGYDRHQIADLAKQDGLKGDYLKASESVKGFDSAKYGADHPDSLEGFLFPATYELPRHPTVEDLIARQLDAFKQYFSRVDLSYAKSKNLTPYDVLIIASMIEREAIVEKDRPLIAAVIYNRLHDGMALGIDATIRYAENNWTKPLTESDLQLDSPYNTRTHTGLPPTPIGNPGLASIKAAARPANVNYLYYVAKTNGCGHFFTASYQEFLAASDKYNAAREAAGGKSPAQCS